LSTFVGTLGEFFLELRWKNPLGLKWDFLDVSVR
jgi:hypothetical protein